MDVIPLPAMQWLARCDECGNTRTTDEQHAAWSWLVDHPCRTDVLGTPPMPALQ